MYEVALYEVVKYEVALYEVVKCMRLHYVK